jgi:hypothetical protein
MGYVVRLFSKSLGLLVMCLTISSNAFSLESANYLPDDADLDTSLPSPESVFGWEPGDWKVDHATLMRYLQELDKSSDLVSSKLIGYTYEQRALMQVIITSKENQANLEDLRQAHLKGAINGDLNAPLVIWLGYSVHGNESSGSNAVPIVAWYLAASKSAYVKELLKNTIVILDPSLNPDGMDRFASWSNSNRSITPVADPNSRIHNEDWPQGRTNHYLFDLNRDWLPVVHPESQARIAEFQRWLPHVITDHHETGHEGFFFQPGIPSRQHPLTTQENLDMTRALAKYHAQSFDQAGVMYFTEDAYDDFYYGKGSTYPDINGSIGILFEQPRVNGAIFDGETMRRTFVDAIHNQVRMSLSTLKGSHELRDEFKRYQSGFFEAMKQRAAQSGLKGWVIGDGGDLQRGLALMNVFAQHGVKYKTLEKEIRMGGKKYEPGHAWVIHADQQQFGLAQAMIELRTEFEDDAFYDVSAWSLPLAYNLPYSELKSLPATGDNRTEYSHPAVDVDAGAWVISWQQLNAPVVLQQLLEAGAIVRAATRPFTYGKGEAAKSFSAGSLVVLPGIQKPASSDAILKILQSAGASGVHVDSYSTLITESGPGLGTSHFLPLKPVKPLLVSGEGTRAYDVGEVWFELDQRLKVPPVMVDIDRLSRVNLSEYTHLLVADGSYSGINKDLQASIASWVKAGGVIIATRRGASWAESLCFSSDCSDEVKNDKSNNDKPGNDEAKSKSEQSNRLAYDDHDQKGAELTIGGAIVGTRVDNTHPVAFGFADTLAVFRRGTTLLKSSKDPFANPVVYSDKPLISGYIGAERLAQMSNQPSVVAERYGSGAVIKFANNPLFRGFWRGTERLWVNALYFGPIIKDTNLPD